MIITGSSLLSGICGGGKALVWEHDTQKMRHIATQRNIKRVLFIMYDLEII